jgi:hypothetical protein
MPWLGQVEKALSSRTMAQQSTSLRHPHPKKQGHITNTLPRQFKINNFILTESEKFWAVGLNTLESGVITQERKLRPSTL